MDAAALTPPMHATASPDHAAARRGDPDSAPFTSGRTTHVAMAIGSASIEIDPIVESIRGEST